MSFSMLNNVSALAGLDQLSTIQTSLSKTLTQLATGSRINSGGDDAAGLSIADGIQANITALTQSSKNASDGIGLLQTADGALAQVTTLLNRAVTLATEAANGEMSNQQRSVINQEYQSILTEINQIGSNTQYNGAACFVDGNSSPVDLVNGGTTISGTIPPADTLSGSITVTTTVPGFSGTTSSISLGSSAGSIVGTITSGAVLQGGFTLTSGKAPTTSGITFTVAKNQYNTSITSSRIAAGSTLSGTLDINSASPDGKANVSDALDLSNYQGLASSNAATAAAAANQLASNLTAAFADKTGETYIASISGGVLQIVTDGFGFTASGNTLTSIAPILTGYNLFDAYEIYSSIGNASTGNQVVTAAEKGLTSNNPATVNTALAAFGAALTSELGPTTHSTYTATLDSNHKLVITSSNAAETLSAVWSPNQNATGQTLAVDSSSNGQETLPAVNTSTSISLSGLTTGNLQSTLQSQLGSNYTVAYDPNSGAFSISISNAGTANGFTSIASSNVTTQQTVGARPDVSTPTTVSLAGQTASTLQNYLQTQLGSDCTVAYDSTSGALNIGISGAGTTAGITSIAASGITAKQTKPSGGNVVPGMTIYTSDGTTNGSQSLDVTVGLLGSSHVGTAPGGGGEDLSSTDLTSQPGAAAALIRITAAIGYVAAQRAHVGASMNALQSTIGDVTTQTQNLTSAESAITSTDIGKVVTDMAKLSILQSTCMAALREASQSSQLVLKLLE